MKTEEAKRIVEIFFNNLNLREDDAIEIQLNIGTTVIRPIVDGIVLSDRLWARYGNKTKTLLIEVNGGAVCHVEAEERVADFEFRCPQCGYPFDQKFSEVAEDRRKCPNCGKGFDDI